jgi:glutathione peroxidase
VTTGDPAADCKPAAGDGRQAGGVLYGKAARATGISGHGEGRAKTQGRLHNKKCLSERVFRVCPITSPASELPMTIAASSIQNRIVLMAALGALALPAWAASPANAGTTTAPAASCSGLLQQSYLRLQDEKPQSLCQYSGKVVVVVNTASFCGFTSQYEGLEALYSKYKDRGLVVLGFPSNDFSQETGSNKQIAEFCENTFGVKFPMAAKSAVTGKDAIPLFKELATKTNSPPRWNFFKYVIARDGVQVAAFNSATDPASPQFVREIEKQLGVR